jgi:hypothetical protein
MIMATSPCRRAHPRLHALSPISASRPRRSWLVAISVLWVSLWLQFAVVPAAWDRLVALVLFGIACVDTVLYGMSLPPRHARGPDEVGVLASSGIGVLTLAAVSWAPILAFGVYASVTTVSIGPLLALLVFGLPVSLAVAGAGLLIMLVLLALGRVLVWRPR